MKRLVATALVFGAVSCAPVQDKASGPQLVPPPPLPKASISLLVDKSDRTLAVYRGDRLLRTYTDLAFGEEPRGHKRFQGDERTPEGHYIIDTRNPRSAYHLSLRISYPNADDRNYAASQGRNPGGDIFIHGQPNRYANRGPDARIAHDWTDGCVAVSNADIRELWALVPDGSTIEIRQ